MITNFHRENPNKLVRTQSKMENMRIKFFRLGIFLTVLLVELPKDVCGVQSPDNVPKPNATFYELLAEMGEHPRVIYSDFMKERLEAVAENLTAECQEDVNQIFQDMNSSDFNYVWQSKLFISC